MTALELENQLLIGVRVPFNMPPPFMYGSNEDLPLQPG
jgi:hypothetical protein